MGCFFKGIQLIFLIPIKRKGFLTPDLVFYLIFQIVLTGLTDTVLGIKEKCAAIIRVFQLFLADVTRYGYHKCLLID